MLASYDTLSGSSHIQPGRNAMAMVGDLLSEFAKQMKVSLGPTVQAMARKRLQV